MARGRMLVWIHAMSGARRAVRLIAPGAPMRVRVRVAPLSSAFVDWLGWICVGPPLGSIRAIRVRRPWVRGR